MQCSKLNEHVQTDDTKVDVFDNDGLAKARQKASKCDDDSFSRPSPRCLVWARSSGVEVKHSRQWAAGEISSGSVLIVTLLRRIPHSIGRRGACTCGLACSAWQSLIKIRRRGEEWRTRRAEGAALAGGENVVVVCAR